MATHSSTFAWRIPWTEEASSLHSMGSLGVGQDLATSLSLFTFLHWRRKWKPTPVFLPGESQGQGCLVGCCLWGCTELDTTEATQQQQQQLSSALGKSSGLLHRKYPLPLPQEADVMASSLTTSILLVIHGITISMGAPFTWQVWQIYHFIKIIFQQMAVMCLEEGVGTFS